MDARMKAMAGAAITAFIIFYLGVTYFYGPVTESNPAPPEAMMSSWLSLLIVAVVFTIVLDWAARATGNAVRAALTIALAQIALVDIYYPLIGDRSWAAAGASAVLLLVGWFIIGTVYGKLSGGGQAGGGQAGGGYAEGGLG